MGNLEATPGLSKDDNLLLRALHDGMASRSEDGETIDKRTFLQFFDFPGMFGERLFALFDQKHSGRINKEEFLKGMAIYLNGSTDQKIRLLFKLYDLQDHNKISVSELQTMLYSLARTPSLIPGYVDSEGKHQKSLTRINSDGSFSCKNPMVATTSQSSLLHSPHDRAKLNGTPSTYYRHFEQNSLPTPLNSTSVLQTLSPPPLAIPPTIPNPSYPTSSSSSSVAAVTQPQTILMTIPTVITSSAPATTFASPQQPTTPGNQLQQQMQQQLQLQMQQQQQPMQQLPLHYPIPPAAATSNLSPAKAEPSPRTTPSLLPTTPNPKSATTPPLSGEKEKRFSLRASLTNVLSRRSPTLNPQKSPELKPQPGGTPVQGPQTSPQMMANCAPIVPTTPFEEEHLHLMHIVNDLVEKTFHEHNVHRDGLLSYEEFAHWVKQCPAMLEMMDFKFNRHAWKAGFMHKYDNGTFHQGPLCVPKKPFGWRYHMFVLRDPFLYKFEVNDKDLEKPVDIVFLDGMTIEGDEENEIINSHHRHEELSGGEHDNHITSHNTNPNLRLPFTHREDKHSTNHSNNHDEHESRSHNLRLPSFLHHERGDRDRTDSKMVAEEEPLMESKDPPEPMLSARRGISQDKKPSIKETSDMFRTEMLRQSSLGEHPATATSKSNRTTSFSFKHQDEDRRIGNPSHFHELCEGHAGYYGFRMVTSHIDKETHEPVRKETMLYALSQLSRATWVRLLRKAAHSVSITKYYSIGKRIGKGKFGTVYQGTHFKTGEIVAIKAMDKSRVTQKDHEGLRAEIAILKLLVHPCVVRMRQVFESERYIYIVMDLHPAGDLGHKLLAVNQFPQTTCRAVCHKLLETLQYLHQRGIVHRDIKPENIMLKDPNDFTQIVLIDFGLSKFAIPNEKMAETIGTIDYLAPEIFSKNYSFKVDQWALGVLLYAMLSGLLPFWGETLQAQRKSIETMDPDFTAPEWKGISKDAIDLIKGLLQKDPAKRLSIDEALKHRWFNEPVPPQLNHQKSVVMHLSNVGDPPPFSALPPAAAPGNKEEGKMPRSASSQRLAPLAENGGDHTVPQSVLAPSKLPAMIMPHSNSQTISTTQIVSPQGYALDPTPLAGLSHEVIPSNQSSEFTLTPQTHILSSPVVVSQPQAMTLQPQAMTLQPQAMTLQPQAMTLQPQAMTLQPQAMTLQPQAATSPSLLVPQAQMSSPRTIVLSPQLMNSQPVMVSPVQTASMQPVA